MFNVINGNECHISSFSFITITIKTLLNYYNYLNNKNKIRFQHATVLNTTHASFTLTSPNKNISYR